MASLLSSMSHLSAFFCNTGWWSIADRRRMAASLAATVCFLLFFLLIFWLAVKTSTAFYIVGLVVFTTILSIFLWIFAGYLSGEHGNLGVTGARLVAFASVVCFVTMVVLLWVRFLGARKICILTGATCGAVILAFVFWAVTSWFVSEWRNRRTTRGVVEWEEEVRLEYNFLRRFAGLPMEFTYEELVAATENFRSLVGKGGCSSVFKGVLEDGTAAAVKRLERESRLDREFRSEVAAIASVQHVNLVRLLGYCLTNGGHRFLVYEFFPNGSLDAWIFPVSEGHDDGGGLSFCLSWALRYQVALDVARALAYLHHDCRLRVVHLDIKPENILLDCGFRACVADFGMAKLTLKDDGSIYTTLRGTRGYFAPEWFSDGGVSEKSDVYSFGLVLMELMGGRRNMPPPSQRIPAAISPSTHLMRPIFFPKIVDEKLREGKVMEVVDHRLLGDGGGVAETEVALLARVALWCTQERPDFRPSMATVVDMLRGYVAVEMPPASPMFMVNMLEADMGEERQRPGVHPLPESFRSPTSSSTADVGMESHRPLYSSPTSSTAPLL